MKTPEFDAIVVGTGAGGGCSAYRLARGGLKVLNLEYGPWCNDEDLGSTEQFYDAYPRLGYKEITRRRSRPGPGSWKRSDYFLYPEQDDYQTEGEGWYWRRYRNVGGRSTWWAGVAPRMSPLDFKEGDIDGFGPVWPLSYDDLRPYYDWIDVNLGRVGPSEDHPDCPAGLPQTPQALRCGERIIQHACESLNGELPLLRYTHTPKMIATRPMGPGRAPCSYLGNCMEGCRSGAKFSSNYHLYPAALQTGNLRLRPNSVVAEVLADPDTGLASGVRFFDRLTRKDYEVHARAVIVAASTIETARILLNSKSTLYPGGIGNGSGHVGKHLGDQVQASANGYLPELYGHRAYNDDGYTFGVMIPRFTRSYQKDFIRGWEGRSGSGKGIDSQVAGFGASLKQGIREHYQAGVRLLGFGAKLDNPGTFIEIDPSGKTDAFGIPVAKIHSASCDNDRRMFADIVEKFTRILERAGAEHINASSSTTQAGTSEHEVGTCRMTADPKAGVCDGFGRSHEVGNLFLADGSVFTQQTDKSPTLTIMALALRQADFIVGQFNRGEL